MIPNIVLSVYECQYVIYLQFLYSFICILTTEFTNVQNMVDDNYLALFTSLCCPHVAGFHLRENAVGEL
jgi:hypothetical protein